MKDFLHGRPNVASTRGSSPNITLPSNLPPISPATAIDESMSDDLANSNDAEGALLNSVETCSGEPQVEIVPDAEGRVGHIVVTCRCGDKITLQCNY